MKVVFFGLGSIGKRQARLLKANFNHKLYAFRSGEERGNELGIPELYDWDSLDRLKPDVAFITNPTKNHIPTALACAERKINLFIEKPLSHNLENVSLLMNKVEKHNLTAYVAYCLRFHPVIMWMKEHLIKHKPIHVSAYASSYLPDWRPGINHLEHYSAKAQSGGGVILELSHEIDYLCYLLGEPTEIHRNYGKISSVTIDAEDFADLLLTFGNAPVNLHLNFFSRLNRREIIIDFNDHTIVGDLLSNEVKVIASSSKSSENNSEEIIKFNLNRDNLYLSQLEYFFNNFKNPAIMNNLGESMDIFRILIKIKRKSLP